MFEAFVKEDLDDAYDMASGNPFASFQHDGGDGKDKMKYETLALQFINKRGKNLTVCLAVTIVPLTSEDDDRQPLQVTAACFEDVFKKRTGFTIQQIVRLCVQDGAALAVASYLGYEKFLCLMHSADKIGRAAVGVLTYSRKCKVQNPFPAGDAVVKTVSAMCTCFAWGGSKLVALWDADKSGCTARIATSGDTCATRIQSLRRSMESVLRLSNALKAWEDKANNNDKPFEHDRQKWKEIQEFEAVLSSVANLTTFAQYHKLELTAYRTIAIRALLYCFVTRQHFMVDIDNLKARGAVPRIRCTLKTPVGIEANNRGLEELLFRYGEDGVRPLVVPFVDVDDADADARIEEILSRVAICDNEKIAHALDWRTCYGSPLFGHGDKRAKREVANPMIDKLEVAYLKHAKRAAEFAKEKAAGVHAGANGGARRHLDSIFAPDDDDDDGAREPPPSDKDLKAKFRRYYKQWTSRASTLDWQGVFKEEFREHNLAEIVRKNLNAAPRVNDKGEETEGEEEKEKEKTDDVVDDDDDNRAGGGEELFPDAVNADQDFIFPRCALPMSARVYTRLTAEEYGFLPAMAMCHTGSPSSEAFRERIISYMNLNMNDRSTSLHPEMMEKLVLLMVNREYMEMKREERKQAAMKKRFDTQSKRSNKRRAAADEN